MKFKSFISCIVVAVLVGFFIIGGNVANAETPARVAVLPFKVNAASDYTFLKNGIVDMLSSRLSWPGKVSVLGREETAQALSDKPEAITADLARKIGKELSVDYVLFGSLTILGGSASIDAKMADVSDENKTTSFFEQTTSLDEIIPRINAFAEQINAQVFDRQVTATAAPPVSPKSKGGASAPIYAHPEKLLESGGGGGYLTEDETGDRKGSFIFSGSSKREFWKSRNFSELINGIACGDVDQDGLVETVIVTEHQVTVYRMQEGRFYKAADVIEKGSDFLVGVDVADINGNGYPEIFVSALNALRNKAASFVLEYDGNQYRTIAQNESVYYRVVDSPTETAVLFAQKQPVSADPFSGTISEMTWQQGMYLPQRDVGLDMPANVLGVAAGDITNEHALTYAAYSPSDRLALIGSNGGRMWESDEAFGGNTAAFSKMPDDFGTVENSVYLPVRILTADTDNDGSEEVITVKNHEVTGRKLGKFRHFTKAEIIALTWDRLGLTPKWKTRKVSGRISDLAIADIDNDGQRELIAAVVSKEGAVIGTSAKSSLIFYEMTSLSAPEKK